MYQVLYRKWRPQTFSDVVGQNHITATLTNELKENRLSHAYLFTGSRGTGKTSCAKILAKAVNCLNPVDGSPCNQCEICRGIDDGSILDVIEIDAASNNGVDNIRDLRDEANFTPAACKYRVYIIDEVHMLSISAFNALLKTLEEPPSHVVFILATTEVHKLPATILSRCQRFDFKRITPEDISARLEYVSSQEGIELDSEAGVLIARIADGGLRDALSILDQCTGESKKVNVETVSKSVGLANREYLFKLSGYIADKNCAAALEVLDFLHNNSCDMERLCSELINHYRDLMIVKTVKNYKELIVCTQNELNELAEISVKYKLERILYILTVLGNTVAELKKGVNRRIEMEMALVKLCSENLDGSVDALLARISELEAAVKSGLANYKPVMKEQPEQETKQEQKPVIEKEPEKADEPQENTGSTADVIFDKWPEVISVLNDLDKPLVGFLNDSSAYLRGNNLLIKAINPVFGQFIRIKSHYDALNEAVMRTAGVKYKLGIYKNDNVPGEQKKKVDPLEGLMNKINDMEE